MSTNNAPGTFSFLDTAKVQPQPQPRTSQDVGQDAFVDDKTQHVESPDAASTPHGCQHQIRLPAPHTAASTPHGCQHPTRLSAPHTEQCAKDAYRGGSGGRRSNRGVRGGRVGRGGSARNNYAQQPKQMTHSEFQCVHGGFERASRVFTLYRVYDILMIVSLLVVHPQFDGSDGTMLVFLWALLLLMFGIDIFLASRLLWELDSPKDVFQSLQEQEIYWELLERLSLLNLTSNTVTLSTWMVYQSVGATHQPIVIAVVTILRLVKLWPVCQFHKALAVHPEEVCITLREFQEGSLWHVVEAMTCHETESLVHSHNGLRPSEHGCASCYQTVLFFILLGAGGVSLLNTMGQAGESETETMIPLPLAPYLQGHVTNAPFYQPVPFVTSLPFMHTTQRPPHQLVQLTTLPFIPTLAQGHAMKGPAHQPVPFAATLPPTLAQGHAMHGPSHEPVPLAATVLPRNLLQSVPLVPSFSNQTGQDSTSPLDQAIKGTEHSEAESLAEVNLIQAEVREQAKVLRKALEQKALEDQQVEQKTLSDEERQHEQDLQDEAKECTGPTDKGGVCLSGYCWLTGLITGVFSGTGTTALLLMHHSKLKSENHLPKDKLEIILGLNWASCVLGGLLGGIGEKCAGAGFTSAMEGSMMIFGMLVALFAL